MSDRRAEFGPDVAIVVVTFTQPEQRAAYLNMHTIDLEVLTDADRVGYRSFGLGRGSFARIWGLRSLRRYAQIFRSTGFGNLRRATDDTRQLGGDFVIDRDGRLRYGYWGRGPYDRPDLDALIAAARAS